jgi:hypothetical protein
MNDAYLFAGTFIAGKNAAEVAAVMLSKAS